MRLSVFAGGFDLEAAHGVCGAEDDTDDDTLELLTRATRQVDGDDA